MKALAIAATVGIASMISGNVTPQGDALARFRGAVDAYVRLHRQIEQQQPPFSTAMEAASLLHAVDRLAVAIVAARPDARRGDLFDDEVSPILRLRLEAALRANDLTTADVVASLEQDEEELPGVRVNGRFPPRLWTAMRPCLLQALPELPEELQYRFVGRDLVMVDVHANIVVDILPRALPAGAERKLG
jgi:hypothetical protein